MDDNKLRQLLSNAHTIAVVGHSDKPHRTSYRIAQFLRNAGYQVFPVNPTVDEIDGFKAFPNLAAIPVPLDIVNVFRRAQHLAAVVQEALAVQAGSVWGQLGVTDPVAAQIAQQAALDIVMDLCIMVEHKRLLRSF
ncbi:MAG: CoA-binding protein [Anaerolineae bacterium]|nr:CoA-binding protein [Anaerolineae bacterium]